MKNILFILVVIFSPLSISGENKSIDSFIINNNETSNMLSFSTDLAILSLSNKCIDSVIPVSNHTEKSATDEILSITLTKQCENMFITYTESNIGHEMTLSINNKPVVSATVVSKLSSSFHISVDKNKFSQDINVLLEMFPQK